MIVIFCPKSIATGGTELLHQLGYKLNLFGFEAGIYYYGDERVKETTSPNFLKYNVPSVETLSDSEDNIYIYPEALVSSLEATKSQLPGSKHVLWWLSVDNAGMTPELENELSKDKDLIHFVQSYYAEEYVRDSLSIPEDRLFYLSDYLNYNYLYMDDTNKRDDIVLFNPKKGFDRTATLIGNSDHRIKWQAINGLPQKEVPNLLKSAKVYIDFGNHPGKDRFPREAVCCGCRIITGRRGSAANDTDIPILDQLKVSDDADDSVILMLIYTLLENYDKNGNLYLEYKNKIKEEFRSFEEDLLRVFLKISDHHPVDRIGDRGKLKDIIVDAVSKEEYTKALSYITLYRIEGYDMDEDMYILESYARLGIPGEQQAALYAACQVIDKNDNNYEAHLLKAQALIALGMEGADRELDLAQRYSTGTDDEEYITEAIRVLAGSR